MSTYFYKHTYVYFNSINTFKRLSRLNLKIYEVAHQKHLPINEDIVFH
jgi:hypothetical protein